MYNLHNSVEVNLLMNLKIAKVNMQFINTECAVTSHMTACADYMHLSPGFDCDGILDY